MGNSHISSLQTPAGPIFKEGSFCGSLWRAVVDPFKQFGSQLLSCGGFILLLLSLLLMEQSVSRLAETFQNKNIDNPELLVNPTW